jgi:chromosome segregation ATPase
MAGRLDRLDAARTLVDARLAGFDERVEEAFQRAVQATDQAQRFARAAANIDELVTAQDDLTTAHERLQAEFMRTLGRVDRVEQLVDEHHPDINELVFERLEQLERQVEDMGVHDEGDDDPA